MPQRAVRWGRNDYFGRPAELNAANAAGQMVRRESAEQTSGY